MILLLIQADQKMINQYFKFLKDSGYIYWKDKLGFYLERGIKRFSVIQIGPFLDVYYNKKENGKYVLQEKITGQISLLVCLRWIFDRSKSEPISIKS